jgi:hypothetical protein
MAQMLNMPKSKFNKSIEEKNYSHSIKETPTPTVV